MLASADEVRKDRKKAVKHDSVHRLAIIVHSGGQEGVEAAWEATPAFHEAWKAKARDMLARAEFRRQKLSVRLKVAFYSPVRLLLESSWQPLSSCCLLVTIFQSNGRCLPPMQCAFAFRGFLMWSHHLAH
jgi:hypothetical protein